MDYATAAMLDDATLIAVALARAYAKRQRPPARPTTAARWAFLLRPSPPKPVK